jgi:hypothetical protein
MILEYTKNKERIVFWKTMGFINARYNEEGYIEDRSKAV